MKKKLLIFSQANSPHTQSWALPFKDDFEVLIVTFHPPTKKENYQGINIEVIPKKIPSKLDYLVQFQSFQKIVDRFKPDVIHVHYASSYGLIAAAIKTNALKVLTVWGSDVNQARKNFIHRLLIDHALKKYDWINVPSDDLKNTLMEIGISEKKILVFQYGTNLEFCDNLKEPKNNTDKIKITSSRLWHELYKIDKIILGFFEAYKLNKNLELILIGTGTEEENKKIKELVNNHEAINIMGFTDKTTLVKTLWNSNVYISIPTMDGMSLSVLEALYCRCFPILSNIAPNREILNYCKGTMLLDWEIESVKNAILDAAEKCLNTNLDENVKFIDSRANYKKNMDIIRQVYLGEWNRK